MTQQSIAIVLTTREAGGHERMLFIWLRAAVARGLHPVVFCHGDCELSSLANAFGIPQIRVDYRSLHDAKHSRIVMWRNFLLTWRLMGVLPKHQTVLFAPGAMQAGLSHLAAGLLRRRQIACYVPMAFRAHILGASKPWLRDIVTGWMSRKVGYWITISSHQANLLRNSWRTTAPISVLPNRIEAFTHNTGATVKPALVNPDRLTVLFAGRFDAHQKGLDWLAEVIRSSRQLDNVDFIFQGRGEYQPRLEALQQSCTPGRIQLRPWGAVADTFSMVDALILPSRFEGLPLIALEALHAGVPVVASKQSGLSDVLSSECLFDVGKAESFIMALGYLWPDDFRRQAVALAQQRLESLLSASTYDNAVQEVVARLLAPA
jgi:glycosyltransferase involved in cell wall biosynthesis